MPLPKETKNQTQHKTVIKADNEPKQVIKPEPIENKDKDEDRIDFVNVKDLIKGMERQKEQKETQKETAQKESGDKESDEKESGEKESNEKESGEKETGEKETNGFHDEDENLERSDSMDSEPTLSRSNSGINGLPLNPPKPLPRSSISEGGSTDEVSEAPKPKPRTTTGQIAGYKVVLCLIDVFNMLVFFFK